MRVYVTASEAELAKRRKDVGKEFLERQFKLYGELTRASDLTGSTRLERASRGLLASCWAWWTRS
jgi:hypothetical protein